MIAGEELDMDMSQLEFVTADTAVTPNTGQRLGEQHDQDIPGPGVRAAAASARQTLLGLASTQLGVPASQLYRQQGRRLWRRQVRHLRAADRRASSSTSTMPASCTNRSDSRRQATPGSRAGLQAGQAPAKPVEPVHAGRDEPAADRHPGDRHRDSRSTSRTSVCPACCTGAVVRPRGQALYGFGAPIVSVDESSIKHIPDVRIVRKGDFLGVVAPHEYDAIQAAAQLKVKWADPPKALPGSGNEFEGMRALDSAGKIGCSNADAPSPAMSMGRSPRRRMLSRGAYGWPTNLHAPIGPCCAIADVTPQGARIFNGTQGVYKDQSVVAAVLGLPVNKVRVTAAAMSGTLRQRVAVP